MEDQQFYIGQKAFIAKGDEVLILSNEKYALDFPGGKIQSDEVDFSKSLKREVREETQLEIEVGHPFVTWGRPMYGDFEGNRLFLVGYKCKYISGEVVLSDEHLKYQWVNKDNYTDLKENTDYFRALKLYFKGS